jgi:hypothetical protein
MIHIQRVAFLHTQFPLLLMLEVSCGIYQQRRIVNILRKVFGDTIFTPIEAKAKLLPSPSELRGRVVIFLSHRKRQITSAYRLHDEQAATPLRDEDTRLKYSTQVSGEGGDEGSWFNGMKYSSDLDSDGSDGDQFSISTPLRTMRETPLKADPSGGYRVVDPEIASNGRRGPDDNEEGAIDASLMRLCHYSKSHQLATRDLKSLLQTVDRNPEAVADLILSNMTRFRSLCPSPPLPPF